MAEQRQHRGPLLAGIIGYPLGHSVSPAFHQAAFDRLGLDARFERWETPPEFLAPRLLGLRRHGILGACITVPHKEQAMKLLDEADDAARRIGAVNTIVNRRGHLVGHNTDAPGFLRSLVEDGALDPKGKRVLVLGAGGAARAVAFALLQARAGAILVANRTAARAEALVAWLRLEAASGPTAVTTFAWGADPGEVEVIVNATTLGMRHTAEEGQSPLDPSALRPGMLVCDLVYNPPETPLLAAARSAGARALGGLPMLIYQGALAFELWTGQTAPIQVMFATARRALEEQG